MTEVLIRAATLREVSEQLVRIYNDGRPKPEVRFTEWLHFQLKKSLGDIDREQALKEAP